MPGGGFACVIGWLRPSWRPFPGVALADTVAGRPDQRFRRAAAAGQGGPTCQQPGNPRHSKTPPAHIGNRYLCPARRHSPGRAVLPVFSASPQYQSVLWTTMCTGPTPRICSDYFFTFSPHSFWTYDTSAARGWDLYADGDFLSVYKAGRRFDTKQLRKPVFRGATTSPRRPATNASVSYGPKKKKANPCHRQHSRIPSAARRPTQYYVFDFHGDTGYQPNRLGFKVGLPPYGRLRPSRTRPLIRRRLPSATRTAQNQAAQGLRKETSYDFFAGLFRLLCG